jgi:hypothetical protein
MLGLSRDDVAIQPSADGGNVERSFCALLQSLAHNNIRIDA